MVLSKLALAGAVLLSAASAHVHEAALEEIRPDLALPYSDKPLHQRKMDYWEAHKRELKLYPSVRGQPVNCEDGKVTIAGEDFLCKEVDFLSYLGLTELHINRDEYEDESPMVADIWGWVSPSGKEISILCMRNGVNFIDGTDPVNPVVLGYLPSNRGESVWCDVKVYKDHAFIVKDGGAYGVEEGKAVQVFDLRRLEAADGKTPVEFDTDADYTQHGSSHNIISNVETGYMYTCGVRGGINCSTGIHIIDVKDPLNPQFVNCIADDGYVHDAQCVIYHGPDSRFEGREICMGFDVDAMTIWDVTDKQNIVRVSTTPYDGSFYTHQGWFVPGMSHILLDDELDEADGHLIKTRTYIFDATDLTQPIRTGHYDHPINAIDHNLYFWGEIHKNGWAGNPPLAKHPSTKFVYHANYASGLRVVNAVGAVENPPKMFEVGHFDVSPDIETRAFFGSWSTYMHPSGVIAVSAIERGIFFLWPRMAFDDAAGEPTPFPVTTHSPVAAPELKDVLTTPETAVLVIVVGAVFFVSAFTIFVLIAVLKKLPSTPAADKKASSEVSGVANPTFKHDV